MSGDGGEPHVREARAGLDKGSETLVMVSRKEEIGDGDDAMRSEDIKEDFLEAFCRRGIDGKGSPEMARVAWEERGQGAVRNDELVELVDGIGNMDRKREMGVDSNHALIMMLMVQREEVRRDAFLDMLEGLADVRGSRGEGGEEGRVGSEREKGEAKTTLT